MSQRGRFFGAALGVLGGVAACGGDGTGPGQSASSVTGIAGDNQSAPTGGTLAFPLSFVALGSSGQPIQGVRVTWSASPANAAVFDHPTDTSDASGVVSTNVTAGGTVGSITLTATVPGVPNVVFHATVLDPCAYISPLTFGTTVNGFLLATDCNRSNLGFYYDYHGLTLPAGQQNMRIAMRGTGQSPFDTWVDFWTAAGPYIAFDDDSVLGQAQNSQLDIVLPGSSDYIIGASSFDQFTTGAYSLSATTRATPMNGCRQVWVVRGVTVSDSVTASDCADSSATPHYYDVARIIAYSPTVLQIAERSTVINPSLALYVVRPESNYVRHLVASNDDSSATSTNAFIRFQVDTSNVYDVVISTSAAGQTGAYTFSVDTTTTLSPRVPGSAPNSRAREWWRARPGELLLRSRGRGFKPEGWR